MLSEIDCLALLEKCRGDEIWSIEFCQSVGVPNEWVAELADRYESGFDQDRNTIYVDGEMTNQYEGVRDLDIAYKIAQLLNVDTSRIEGIILDRCRQVRAIKDAIDED